MVREVAPARAGDVVGATTVAGLVDARAAATPDRVMLLDEHGRQLTFAEFAADVRDAATTLSARGVRPGDVVAWQLPTRIETAVLMAALARLGTVQVPVLPIHRQRELRFVLRQTGAQWLLVPGVWRGFDHAAMADELAVELGTFRTLVWEPLPARSAIPEPVELPPPPDQGDVVRWVFYSSGTTADPKGARHVDRAAISAAQGMADGAGYRADDRYGIAFPFAHMGGLVNVCGSLLRGYALVLVEGFDPPHAVEVFARNDATIVGGGPAFYRAYLEQQRLRPGRPILPTLRFMIGGGAPMPPSMHAEVRDEIGGRGCAQGYGMTETCTIIAMNHPDDTDEHLAHTVGRVVAGMAMRVRSNGGTIVGPGEEGELEVRGDSLLVGYLDPALDADAFTPDGWFRTGDLGSVDADGYVRITGRRKDIIIRKGENISAQEVEALLYSHPAVADVAVIGLPDEARGELVCAVIVPQGNGADVTIEALAAHLHAQDVMRQKHPERIELVDALPRNSAGKVLKQELVRRFRPSGP